MKTLLNQHTRNSIMQAGFKILIVCLGLLVFFTDSNAQHNTTFGEQQIITTDANSAWSAYACDIDGDGDIDVLSPSRFSWYENTDGNGTFGAQHIISTTNYATDVYACDIDGDGDNDVLAALSNSNIIAWYENTDGNGTFGAQQIITTMANRGVSVYACDIDGDGDNDVLSASVLDDKIAWYENTDGIGTFGEQQIITINAGKARCVYACDIDGDGDIDVLSASEEDDKIAWYENTDGNGTFGAQQIITIMADGAKSVYACDIDGDGDNDVLSASGGDDKIAWYENIDGNGTFGEQLIITTNTEDAWSVYACDIDGDDDIDVLSASVNDDKIAWYENTNGNGTFSEQLIITYSNGPVSVFACDIDSDGDNDVLSVSYYNNEIIWNENKRFTETIIYPNGGEKWPYGSTKYIAWTIGETDNIKLEYSYNNGSTYNTIISNLPVEVGSYEWVVSGTYSDSCLIRISAAGHPEAYDVSDSVFSIHYCLVPYTRIEFYEGVTANETNPNNLIMPGATVRFKLQAVNNFTQNLLTLHGDISTTSPYIDTIIDAEGSFNNIIQGEKGWSSDYYEIQLADELPPNGIIEFTLTMYDEIIASETWISSFEIPVIELSHVLINDDNFRDSHGNNNNIVEGGETIEIHPLFDNNSYMNFYQATMQLTTGENYINIWNNQTGATGIVYDTCDIMQQPIIPQSTANSGKYDFVFTNTGSTGSPEFIPVLTGYAYSEPDTSWDIGGILMKYGMPFTLHNGEPGAGDLIPVTGDVNYTRTEFYQNVSASPENPSNIITPNKKVRFKLQIDNNTDHNLIALAGTISTDSTNVTITDSIGSFNNVAKDTTGWSSDEFEILIGDTFPVSGELSFTLTLNDPFYESGTWIKNFTIPFLDFAQVVIDDDPNPDSNGDNDDIAEPGETIEVIPLLKNLSQTTFYSAEGQLVTTAPYINIWNNVTGSTGTVYDTYIYNNGDSITPVSTGIMPNEDFVLDHNGDQTYSLDFSVITTTYAKAARDSSFETGGIRMVFGVPFAMNDGYPSAPVIITSPLEGDDIAKGNIVTVMVDANTISPVTVSKVDFYVNDVLIGTDTGFPYTYDWNTNGETSGENTIKAIMTDNQSDTFECEVTVNILDVYVVEASDDFSFFIPNEVFTGISPTDSTCTVLLTNGNFLPSWLSFDDSTLIFSGIAPAFNEVYFITIVADDGTQTITYNFVLKIMGTLMPSITLSASGLDFGDVVVDSTSNTQTYTVEGTELTDSILITAPSGFEISHDGTTFTDTLTLSPTDGTVSQTTIYVQFTPVAEQAYSGNILHENTDVTTINVAVSGEGVSSLPIMTVSETGLNFGGVVVDSTSNTQTYTVEGTELTDSILIVAPSGFEISTDGTIYIDTLTLDPVSGTVSQTTIYVQFTPIAEQAYSGNILHENKDVTTINVAVSGEGVNASSPIITVSETSFDFGDVEVDSTSNTQTYTVEGANLTADILIIVPSGFEISLDDTTYTDTLTLSPAGGTVSQTTIYVQFAPTNQQAYSGNISHISTDATTVSIAVSGNAIVTAIGKIDSEMFIIYPNPVNNILTIEKSTGNEKCILEIYSITGEKLAVYNMETNKKEIDLSNFNSSVYFLKISTNRGYEVRKIIKF